MLFVFAFALFLSAALLFWIQPLVGKLLLPALGGTPAVWNTCMLFFQCMLLAGYAYALIAARKFSLRIQVVVQGILLLLAISLLPVAISAANLEWLSAGNPIFRLLGVLFLTVGLPFFILSTHGPLLQNWFAHTPHSSAKDPYFLYAASNLGSFIALLAFPFFLEPNLVLGFQSRLWTIGYYVMLFFIVACTPAAWVALKSEPKEAAAEPDREIIGTKQRLSWLALAFIPSSLMLGTTLYISTDIAAVPLLWVIPLALYLITFVLAFARKQIHFFGRITLMFPGAALILTFVYLSGAAEPVWFLILLHLIFFFIAAMLCHGQLARSRPSARHLVQYYFWVALGGMTGGLFNALLAPVVFNRVIEYPVAIVLACFAFRHPGGNPGSQRPSRFVLAFPAGIFILTALLAFVVRNAALQPIEKLVVILGIPIILTYALRQQTYVLGLSVTAIMLGSLFYSGTGLRVLHINRNFFGVLRVTADAAGTQHHLYNGDTVHGKQFTDVQRGCEPLAYYHRRGPLGEIMEPLNASTGSSKIAVIGLGTGAMAAYSKPGQDWTFYEINPAVLQIAQTSGYFKYLSNCSRAPIRTVLGDARIKLRLAEDSSYSMIVLDAFSSDAVPTHLITREAIRLYFSKITPTGIMAFHISNRSLDLSRVLAGIAAKEGFSGYYYNDKSRDKANGKDPSSWAVMARRSVNLQSFTANPHWIPLGTVPRPVVWTDDFSNILHVLKW